MLLMRLAKVSLFCVSFSQSFFVKSCVSLCFVVLCCVCIFAAKSGQGASPINKKDMNKEKFLTTKEAAEYLRTTPNGIYDLVRRNKVPCYRPAGKRLLFDKDELDKWVISSVVNSMEGSV